MLGMIVQVLGVMLLSQPLAARFGKRNVFIVCLSLTTLLTAVIFFVPSNRVGTMFIINFLRSLAYAPTIPLLWAMMADVADYGEWKYNRRATGFVFAGVVFALKAGLGFGGALCGWIIGAFGYDREKIDNMAEVILDEKVLLGIKLSGSIFPAITFFIGVLALLTYKISKSFNEKIQADLAIRRQKE
jgi:Na+/melibiose symporter-like transporter